MENWASILKGFAKTASLIAKRLEAYAKIKEQAVANVNILEKKLAEIKKLVRVFPGAEIKSKLTAWSQEETEFIKKTKEEFRYQFGNELKGLLAKDGLVLKGQIPLLRAGLYTIKLNFDIGSVTLYWGPEIQIVKSKVPLSAQAIHGYLRNFHQRIEKEVTSPQEFLKHLFQAYQRHILFNKLALGSKIFLVDLLSELVFIAQPVSFRADPVKDKFREYSRIQFSYNLYKLKKNENYEIGNSKLRLSVATFEATTDKTKSLWIPDNENGDGTYYSYIAFEEKKE